jgi:hypothetical protein
LAGGDLTILTDFLQCVDREVPFFGGGEASWFLTGKDAPKKVEILSIDVLTYDNRRLSLRLAINGSSFIQNYVLHLSECFGHLPALSFVSSREFPCVRLGQNVERIDSQRITLDQVSPVRVWASSLSYEIRRGNSQKNSDFRKTR